MSSTLPNRPVILRLSTGVDSVWPGALAKYIKRCTFEALQDDGNADYWLSERKAAQAAAEMYDNHFTDGLGSVYRHRKMMELLADAVERLGSPTVAVCLRLNNPSGLTSS
jgi:hypothetical protein